MRIGNEVKLIGNLGKDVEVREFSKGKKLAQVSMATQHVYRNKNGEKVVDVQWHTLKGWGKTAEMMERLLAKGKRIAVTGRLTYNDYEDKNGIKRRNSEILVSEFMLLSKKS
jgi:single-strand DNA-binding protein